MSFRPSVSKPIPWVASAVSAPSPDGPSLGPLRPPLSARQGSQQSLRHAPVKHDHEHSARIPFIERVHKKDRGTERRRGAVMRVEVLVRGRRAEGAVPCIGMETGRQAASTSPGDSPSPGKVEQSYCCPSVSLAPTIPMLCWQLAPQPIQVHDLYTVRKAPGCHRDSTVLAPLLYCVYCEPGSLS